MADTKISALTDGAAPIATDRIPVARSPFGSGDNRYLTPDQVKTYVNTAPVFAAGTSSANSHPVLTDGTLLTTTEHGAMEHAGSTLHFTPSATTGSRGYIPVKYFIRCDSTRTLPNDTNENAIFNSPANGRITLDAGVYRFEGIISVSSMSATSGNALIDILGAGTATCDSWLWTAQGRDNNSTTAAATVTGSFTTTQQSAASIVTAGTGTAMQVMLLGTFACTAGGTAIPSIDQVTAAAAVVGVGSYIMFERIGNDNVVSLGPWD